MYSRHSATAPSDAHLKEDPLSRLVVINHVTLDGVMQAPGRADEDTRDGFPHGGWAIPNNDEAMVQAMAPRMAQGGPLLLGRRTYEALHDFWPRQTDNPFTDALNAVQKYVVSTTLREPLPWSNSTLIGSDPAWAAAKLKEQPDGEIVVMGSGELLQTLMKHDLVDAYLLMIHPLVLGRGRRLFTEGSPFASLRLIDSVTTTTGVMIATYHPADVAAGRAA
jgi:dihydrofolate reductase